MITQCNAEILKELITIEEKINQVIKLAQQNNLKIDSDEILRRLISSKLNA